MRSDQCPKQGAFSCTVGPEQAGKTSGLHTKMNIAEDEGVAVAYGEAGCFQYHAGIIPLVSFGVMPEFAEQRICQRLAEVQTVFGSLDKKFAQTVASAAEMTASALKKGRAVYFVGNGGSAADAQHWAAELVGRYLHDHTPLNAHALTVNSSVMTALGNDFPADEIFSR